MNKPSIVDMFKMLTGVQSPALDRLKTDPSAVQEIKFFAGFMVKILLMGELGVLPPTCGLSPEEIKKVLTTEHGPSEGLIKILCSIDGLNELFELVQPTGPVKGHIETYVRFDN